MTYVDTSEIVTSHRKRLRFLCSAPFSAAMGDDRLAAAKTVAARVAASAVFAGRSAAVAVRSAVHTAEENQKISAAVQDLQDSQDPQDSEELQHLQDLQVSTQNRQRASQNSQCRESRPRTEARDSRDVASTVAKSNQAVAAAALRAQTIPKALSSPRVPKEPADDMSTEICEWDVTIQRTFITVVPVCKRLISTAARQARWATF